MNSKGYNNTAFVAVDFGFEVQIDALGRGDPPPGQNVDPKFRTTGAIYNMRYPEPRRECRRKRSGSMERV